MIRLLLGLLALLLPGAALAQNDAAFARDFAAFLRTESVKIGSPGMSVAVTRRDGPIYLGGIGMADRARRKPVTADTRFYIASSTKSFVALAIAQMAARGQVDLDWTLADLAPDIAFAPEVRAKEITLRHLLSHTHGLKSEAMQFRLAYSGDYDDAALWRLLREIKANAKVPVGTFAYNNLGYNIAALLLERKLGISWQVMVEREILTPLKLTNTATRGMARPANRALPYADGVPVYLRKNDATMQSAGGMESTARDMAGWLRLQLANGAAAALTHRPVGTMESSFGPFARTGYGLGWYSAPYDGTMLYHAFGGFPGFRAHASFVPSLGLGVAALANEDGAGSKFTDIAAAYAYDWYALGPAKARAEAETRIAALERQLSDERAGHRAALANAAKPLTLSLPAIAYAGRYCSADWGTLWIAARGTGLGFGLGLLNGRAEAGEEPDSAIVELMPAQRLTFRFALDRGKVASVAPSEPGSRAARGGAWQAWQNRRRRGGPSRSRPICSSACWRWARRCCSPR